MKVLLQLTCKRGVGGGMEGELGRGAESMAQVFHIGLRQCGKT